MRMKECPMCGTQTLNTYGRWYYHANGQQILEFVCAGCAGLHDRLVKAGA